MKKNGFTIIELLATLIVLALVVGIALITINMTGDKAKKKTEKIFFDSIEGAVSTYVAAHISEFGNADDENKFMNYGEFIRKNNGRTSNLERYNGLTLAKVINDEDTRLDLVNPLDKSANCSPDNIGIIVYRDSESVYYYAFSLSNLGCIEVDSENTDLSKYGNELFISDITEIGHWVS